MIGIRVFIVFEEWCQYISKHLERYGNHILFGTIPILSDCRIRGSRNSRYASSGKKKKVLRYAQNYRGTLFITYSARNIHGTSKG